MGSDMIREKGKASPEERAMVFRWIREVRQGDQDAFVRLAERYEPLIESLASRFSREEQAEHSREDLRQEAMVVFYHSILTYDLEQTEVEFGLYAKICMSNALISQLRKRRPEEQSAPPEWLFEAREAEEPSAKLLEQERLNALWDAIEGCLSEFENRIWRLYISGRTAKEIATQVGKDEKSVTNGIYRIRKKLRALLR